jgi:hypothetical protein
MKPLRKKCGSWIVSVVARNARGSRVHIARAAIARHEVAVVADLRRREGAVAAARGAVRVRHDRRARGAATITGHRRGDGREGARRGARAHADERVARAGPSCRCSSWGQLPTPLAMPVSQTSPLVRTPSPHEAEQSESVATVAPGGQQPSPAAGAVMGVLVHAAAHVPPPVSASAVHATPSLQLVGQLPAPLAMPVSQASPASTSPLPHITAQSSSESELAPAGQQPSPLAAGRDRRRRARRGALGADERVGGARHRVVAARGAAACAGGDRRVTELVARDHAVTALERARHAAAVVGVAVSVVARLVATDLAVATSVRAGRVGHLAAVGHRARVGDGAHVARCPRVDARDRSRRRVRCRRSARLRPRAPSCPSHTRRARGPRARRS